MKKHIFFALFLAAVWIVMTLIVAQGTPIANAELAVAQVENDDALTYNAARAAFQGSQYLWAVPSLTVIALAIVFYGGSLWALVSKHFKQETPS